MRDRSVEWIRKREYVGVNQMAGLDATDFVGTGDVAVHAISTFGFHAARLEATTDDIYDARPLPVDFDIDYPLYIRVYWTTEYAGADGTATLVVLYDAKADGELMIAPVTALDTVITALDATAGAFYFQKTAWGKIKGGTFEDGDFIALQINCSAVANITIATEYVHVLGYELEYTPKRCDGDTGMYREADRAYTA